MNHLSSREKYIVIGGCFLALVFICIQFIFLPVYDKKNDLMQTLAAEKAALDQIRVLKAEYLALSPDHSQYNSIIKRRGKAFTLFSFLDRQAAKSGVKGNIEYMKPLTREPENSPFILSIVKLKLSQIGLQDFTRFIRGVESSGKGIWLSSLSMIKSGKKQHMLDVTVEAQTFIPKEGGL